MCGIAGFLLRERPADAGLVRRMCDRIRHRGPDDEGIRVEGGCGIGMRRLSIIDLSTGHQPMTNEDGTLWVVFNGEIYNYQELRAELDSRHQFRTSSDTEVLLHLYEDYGPESVLRLRGMFAYAIWDSRRRQLFVARDRFGKKPLYYAALPEGLYFASEIKCLLEAGVPRDLDQEALRLFFQFNYTPHPWTVYRSIRKLAPGGWLTYSQDGAIRQERYWRPPVPVEQAAPDAEPEAMLERLRQVFDESVRLRMIADVPLGAFLSGGLDSGSVVASMARQSSQPVKTFSVGFEEAEYNELEAAALVAKQYGTDHHAILVRPDVLDLAPRLLRQFDEPFGDSSCLPTYVVSEFAARHVKVALSGDGGDELFAGYDSFGAVPRLRRWDRVPAPLRRLIGWGSSLLPYSAWGKNYLWMVSSRTPLERYLRATNSTPGALLQRLLKKGWLPAADHAHFARVFPDCLAPADASDLAQAVYFETTAKLTEDMLVKVDRMSMAVSLEVRCPLLDHRLAEFAATVPLAWNRQGGRGKAFLIRALGDRLPGALLTRRKMGFCVPLRAWFRGCLRDMVSGELLSGDFVDRGIVSPGFLRYLLREHFSGRRDNSHWLWALLAVRIWLADQEAPRPVNRG